MAIRQAVCLPLILVLLFGGCSKSSSQSSTESERDNRPNILLIVADDLGYADLGVYGGDIETPNIDALAAQGVLFTQFHTAPYCAPNRAVSATTATNRLSHLHRRQMAPGSGSRIESARGRLQPGIQSAGRCWYALRCCWFLRGRIHLSTG